MGRQVNAGNRTRYAMSPDDWDLANTIISNAIVVSDNPTLQGCAGDVQQLDYLADPLFDVIMNVEADPEISLEYYGQLDQIVTIIPNPFYQTWAGEDIAYPRIWDTDQDLSTLMREMPEGVLVPSDWPEILSDIVRITAGIQEGRCAAGTKTKWSAIALIAVPLAAFALWAALKKGG